MEPSPQPARGHAEAACPDCQTPRELDGRFCIGCGRRLEGERQQEPEREHEPRLRPEPAARPHADDARPAEGGRGAAPLARSQAPRRASLGSGLFSGPGAGPPSSTTAEGRGRTSPPVAARISDARSGDTAAAQTPVARPVAGKAKPDDALAPGTRLSGDRYVVGEALGRRGVETLYEASDVRVNQPVVVHVVPEGALDAAAASHLRSRLDALQALHHPGLVRVQDHGSVGRADYWVTERVEGPRLDAFLAERLEAFGIVEAARLLQPLLDVLDHIHPQVVHGAVDPGAIVLVDGDPGQPRLDDFVLESEANGTAGDRPGSDERAAYRAPELVRRRGSDHRADLYSVGALLYRLLTGQVPGPDSPRPSALRPGLPSGVDALIASLLQRSPDQRPASAADVRSRLGALAARERRARHAATTSWTHQYGRPTAIAAGVILIAAVTGIVAVNRLRGSGPRDGAPDASPRAAVPTTAAATSPVVEEESETLLPDVAAAPPAPVPDAAAELPAAEVDAVAPATEEAELPAPDAALADVAADSPDAAALPDLAAGAPGGVLPDVAAAAPPAERAPTDAAERAPEPEATDETAEPAGSATDAEAAVADEATAPVETWRTTDAEPAAEPSAEEAAARARYADEAYRTQWAPQMRQAASDAEQEWRALYDAGEIDESVGSLRGQEALERGLALEEQGLAREAWAAYVEALDAYQGVLQSQR